MNVRGSIAIPVAVGLVIVGTSFFSGRARAGDFPTVPYALLEDSTYQQGCFDPCECPIIEPQPMEGRFDLVFYPFAGPLWTVGIQQVDWKVPSLGIEISGSGTYKRAADMQQLRLDLVVDGDPVTPFDSGWVEGGDAYPAIIVTLSMNQLFCYDIVLQVRAKPATVAEWTLGVDRSVLSWTAIPGSPSYDVVCGDLTTLRATGDFTPSTDLCLANDHGETSLPYGLDVPAGHGVWFLLRAQEGTYDSNLDSQPASRDPGINASALSCP